MSPVTTAVASSETAAHTQTETIHLSLFFPEHEPREQDVHYHIFNESRALLARTGKLVCWVCGTKEAVELHHSAVEFALANGIDVQRFALDHPQFDLTDEESFLAYVEGPGNLLPLCVRHHRGSEGIHLLPYPVWENLRYEKVGLPVFGEVVASIPSTASSALPPPAPA